MVSFHLVVSHYDQGGLSSEYLWYLSSEYLCYALCRQNKPKSIFLVLFVGRSF